jgi:flagellar hook assembly protein FlgD
VAHQVQESWNFGGAGRADSSENIAEHFDQIGSAKTAKQAVNAIGRAVLGESSKLKVRLVDIILLHALRSHTEWTR